MITERQPESWQQLQDWTCQLLNECGWKADTEVTITLPRGSVAVDVHAIEEVQGRDYLNLVECKHWASRVPKHVVHSFRTVVTESGANVGYIVSKEGFQSGAYEAAQSTNIRLLSWNEFQDVFEEQWYSSFLRKSAYAELDPLISYLEPIPAMAHWDEFLDDSHVDRLKEMYTQHQPLGALIMLLMPYMADIKRMDTRIELPLGDRAGDYGALPETLTSCSGYREFLDEITKYSLPILDEFRSFRDIAMERKQAVESRS